MELLSALEDQTQGKQPLNVGEEQCKVLDTQRFI